MKYEVRIGYSSVYTATVEASNSDKAIELVRDLIIERSFKVNEYIEHDFTEVKKVND